MRQTSRLSALLLLALVTHAPADAIRYTVVDLGGSTASSDATGINNSGEVCGFYTNLGSLTLYPFRYQSGFVSSLSALMGGTGTGQAFGINSSGNVTGDSDIAGGFYHAFFYDGSMQDRGTLGGNNSAGLAINDSGDVVGYSELTGSTTVHAMLVRAGGLHSDLGTLGGTNSRAFGVNSTNQIVGWSDVAGDAGHHAFSYVFPAMGAPTMDDLGTLGGTNSEAADVNESGQIVGNSQVSGFGSRAFLYEGGTMRDLGVLDGAISKANAINNRGQIVGYSSFGTTDHAFLYTGGVMRDLNPMLTANSAGWEITEAKDINDAGQIAARGNFRGLASHAVLLNPVNVLSPTVTISGRARVNTSRARLTIRGSTTSEVSNVTYVVRGVTLTASGTATWSARTPRLRNGRTVITVTAHGYGGDSAPARVTIRRG